METSQLIIDRVTESDKADYFRNISHDKRVLETFVCRYAETVDDFDFTPILTNDTLFAIRTRDTGRLMGIILYFDEKDGACEIGYGLGSDFWGRGYATEAVERFLSYLLAEKGMQAVYASCFTGNDASRRVMEKCGMVFDRFSPKEMEYLGVERDLTYYVMTRAGYESWCDGALELLTPSMDYDAEIQAYRRDFLTYGGSMDGCGPLRRFDNTQDWLDKLALMSSEDTVRPDLVPSTQFLYVRKADRKVVGVIQIRHRFNEYLEKYAGHIGYSVCPGQRRRGYASQMLRRVLPVCKGLGIDRVLVCCLRDNEASRRTILKNGGVYESTVYEPEEGVYLERYWIDLTDAGGTTKTAPSPAADIPGAAPAERR